MSLNLVIIDGYNVIRRTPAFANAERISLEHGRAALLTMLAARYRPLADHIIVVFDGAGACETRTTHLGIAQIFSATGCSADECIVRLASAAEAAGQCVCIATDDQGIRVALGGLAPSAQTQGGAELGKLLVAPPRLLEKQYRHRTTIKRILAAESDEDAPNPRDARRSPRKRR